MVSRSERSGKATRRGVSPKDSIKGFEDGIISAIQHLKFNIQNNQRKIALHRSNHE
jgi:hypothetical protein